MGSNPTGTATKTPAAAGVFYFSRALVVRRWP